MKTSKWIVLFSTAFFLNITLYAQEVTGTWYNEEKDAKIEVYKTDDDEYEGKVVWLKKPNRNGKPKVDEQNKDKAKRERKIMGLHILSGLKKKGNQYKDGEIYDPKSGKTYSANMKPDGKNKLKIRGYVGVSLIGRTTVWTRADD